MRAPPGYLLAARYRLVDPVGRGGMGTVWRAKDEFLDRDVAVKEMRLPLVLDEDLRKELCARTEREGRATARVAHPSVITVFDVVLEDNRPWIVMEFLKARSLEEVVRQDGPIPARRVAEIGRQVLSALRAAHAKGILHRDVKPSNVLLAEHDRVVLTDFGLALLEGDVPITQAGIVLGSAGYIAPERVLGAQAGSAADLWSLGATLYTAVEGRGLHGRRTAAAALAALTSGEPIPMSLAGPLAPVLNGLLRIDPNTRLDGAAAALMLARVAAGREAEERPAWGPFQVRPPYPQIRPARAAETPIRPVHGLSHGPHVSEPVTDTHRHGDLARGPQQYGPPSYGSMDPGSQAYGPPDQGSQAYRTQVPAPRHRGGAHRASPPPVAADAPAFPWNVLPRKINESRWGVPRRLASSRPPRPTSRAAHRKPEPKPSRDWRRFTLMAGVVVSALLMILIFSNIARANRAVDVAHCGSGHACKSG
ncbi:serine/threonine-protein kinase [Rhizohabitans arisaemae]|uniref:serine/threonine-protein kinase n=1 Tax=Rhizohabitans arisaemae TaxID=2720610 RepID=UPI0024B06507|nr:serine/threonine-protein kinase [Rhizohabitans arisaemae]